MKSKMAFAILVIVALVVLPPQQAALRSCRLSDVPQPVFTPKNQSRRLKSLPSTSSYYDMMFNSPGGVIDAVVTVEHGQVVYSIAGRRATREQFSVWMEAWILRNHPKDADPGVEKLR